MRNGLPARDLFPGMLIRFLWSEDSPEAFLLVSVSALVRAWRAGTSRDLLCLTPTGTVINVPITDSTPVTVVS